MMQINLIEKEEVTPTQNDIDYSEMLKFSKMMQGGRKISDVTKVVVAMAEGKPESPADHAWLAIFSDLAKQLTVLQLERHALSRQYIKVFNEVLPRLLANPETARRTQEALADEDVKNEMF